MGREYYLKHIGVFVGLFLGGLSFYLGPKAMTKVIENIRHR
jgi:hypothetical protein